MSALDGRMHEEALVRSFIQKSRQERCLALLLTAHRRRDFTRGLAHFSWLEPRCMSPLGKGLHSASDLVKALQHRGAGKTVWAISEDPELDARELNIEDAIDQVWGAGMGTLLSCVPGRLAFFRGEDKETDTLLVRP